ncbi:bifunctional N(6)-L-threonylcarbamoyladenine synthase/serine/threonine protein kinase [Methanospirillum lacunae]|uniref:Probable bifunctional tRNA threonylcarbamoyladenosine biosynthesis protein n=1 Tax=Methanospirillum lacunae TaxID=668570 RepID=A0A2V2N6S6_9EURY|nr:bifunctional N(6)-L-threonylcarbamoyladenine synthase/serine/threonine protein kinase [Methanospirillum lacunae]PWR71937.1 Kae1-associated kinase Bud32 [Methanospirillum lacunae]
MQRSGPVLGIEGTAWNLSAAIFDTDLICLKSKPYKPVVGGIHPREAAQHHAAEIGALICSVLDEGPRPVAVAFSQGPGLGPCLRIVGTAARALALSLKVPLIGVNHCVAHVEIGRYASGFEDPIVLYASGANTQVFGYLNNRYRIFGETLDIGIGNAIDKFARSKGLSHPGGPQIEKLAKDGTYIPLPYTVKGMDLAFSGLISAAKDSHESIANVCYSLQETAFAMCVEVTERALSQTGKNEVILVGGVGANRRLQEMLRIMCEARGASFAVPEMQFLGDNGAMIAYTGRIMLEHGSILEVKDSRVNPSYRADQVPVTWRSTIPTHNPDCSSDNENCTRGAEAVVEICEQSVIKRRVGKHYRHPDLDHRLITERTRAEARLISEARRFGVPTPIMSDITADTIVMERIDGTILKDALSSSVLKEAGRMVGHLHNAGIVHGDLTTSNMILKNDRCYLIDFGLGYTSTEIEARGVDIHVLFQVLESTAPDEIHLKEAFIDGYRETFSEADDVLIREHEIDMRGRYL